MDKEVNEGSDRYVLIYRPLNLCLLVYISRDDKRYTEKKNKSERARRKKEDTAKLRGLVDMTLRCVFRFHDKISLSPYCSSLLVLTLASNVSSNRRKKPVKRKSVVTRLLGPLKRRNRKKRNKRPRQNLRPSRKKRRRRYVFKYIQIPGRLTNKLISLLVLRLRNKRLRLLTQRRRLEGSNAQKKELRYQYFNFTQIYSKDFFHT